MPSRYVVCCTKHTLCFAPVSQDPVPEHHVGSLGKCDPLPYGSSRVDNPPPPVRLVSSRLKAYIPSSYPDNYFSCGYGKATIILPSQTFTPSFYPSAAAGRMYPPLGIQRRSDYSLHPQTSVSLCRSYILRLDAQCQSHRLADWEDPRATRVPVSPAGRCWRWIFTVKASHFSRLIGNEALQSQGFDLRL